MGIKALLFSLVALEGFSTHALDLDTNAPNFQCRITRIELESKKEEGICSGTYLNDRIFVTAAHCFDILDVGANTNQTYSYSVNCFGRDPKLVLAVAVHPFYFHNDIYKFNSSLPLVIDPKFGVFATNRYNDIAMVLTEPSGLTEFPDLPDQNFDSPLFYEKNSCRMLGFSPYYCDYESGSGCYREGFSLKVSSQEEMIDIFCDQSTGAGCYTSKWFNEKTNENSPLLIESTSLDLKSPKLGKGDSGGGLLCTNKSGKEVLAGVHVQSKTLNTVNILNKLGFINSFLGLDEDEFISKSETVKLAPEFRKTLILNRSINDFLKVMEYLDENKKVTLSMSGRVYRPMLDQINNWIIDKPDEVKRLLKEKNILRLQPFIDPSKTWGLWKKKVNLKKLPLPFSGNVIEFNASAKLDDLLSMLMNEN